MAIKPPHTAKPTTKKTGKPRRRNAHRLAKYKAQFARTSANKARRAQRRSTKLRRAREARERRKG